MTDEIVSYELRNGVVWVKARVSGHVYEVGAVFEDEWNLHQPSGVRAHDSAPLDEGGRTTANTMVVAWARDHREELAPLFRELPKKTT